MNARTPLAAAAILVALAAGLAGCSSSAASSNGKIVAVGAENQYTSVISQIGGKYVDATSVMSNPNTDPHTFEASAQVAGTVSKAKLIVQNGLGYDSFMNKIESATSGDGRTVLTAQKVIGAPDSTENPHLWYNPKTMSAVAKAVASSLGTIQPAHKAYFQANLAKFQTSMGAIDQAISTLKSAHPGIPVAVTEPVADYLLEAIGADDKTPWSMQAAIMNDTDPSPQDVSTQQALFTRKQVKIFLYNEQVTDAITTNYLKLAKANGVPVVAVYETMPIDGYTYQTWMLAELKAITTAIESGQSTEKL